MAMHLSVKSLILVLISVEIDGAIRRRTAPNSGADPKWKALDSTGARTLHEEASSGALSAQTAQQQQQQENAAVLSGMGAQYVDMGAAGFADVELKLDMRSFLAQLNMIPTLGQAITNMGNKLESVVENTNSQGVRCGNEILILGKTLEGLIDRDESRIETLIRMVQQLQNHAVKVENKLEKLDSGINHVGNAFGSGAGCDKSDLEGNIHEVLTSLPQIGSTVETLITQVNKSIGILQENMQNSFGVLQSELSVLETISKPGYLCPVSNGASQTETRILSSLSEIGNSLERFPKQIISTLPRIVGSRNETLQEINSLVQTSQQIRSDIDNVRKQLIESKEDIKRYFAQSQKSLQVVRRVVTATTQVVQSSAAAAISASRSLKCAVKNQKPDLDG